MPGSHAGQTVVQRTPASTHYTPEKLQTVVSKCLNDASSATRPVLGKAAMDDLSHGELKQKVSDL